MTTKLNEIVAVPCPFNILNLEMNFGKMNCNFATTVALKEMDDMRTRMHVSAECNQRTIEETKRYLDKFIIFVASLRTQHYVRIPNTVRLYEWTSFVDKTTTAKTTCIMGELVMCHVRIGAIMFAMGLQAKLAKNYEQAQTTFTETCMWFHAAAIISKQWNGSKPPEFTPAVLLGYAQLASACFDNMTIRKLKKDDPAIKVSAIAYQTVADEFLKSYYYLKEGYPDKKLLFVPILCQYQALTKKAVKRIIVKKFDCNDPDTWAPAEGIAMVHQLTNFFTQLDPPDPLNEVPSLRAGNAEKHDRYRSIVSTAKPMTIGQVIKMFPVAVERKKPPVYETEYVKALAMVNKYVQFSSEFIFNCYIE